MVMAGGGVIGAVEGQILTPGGEARTTVADERSTQDYPYYYYYHYYNISFYYTLLIYLYFILVLLSLFTCLFLYV